VLYKKNALASECFAANSATKNALAASGCGRESRVFSGFYYVRLET
jgi:hypothetical protein